MTSSDERLRLASLIQEFLDERIKSFEFDERLSEFWNSPDPVVKHISATCWYFYDDLEDHLISVEKPGWDFLQRLLLLLKSDCLLETRNWWEWSWTQLPAAAGVIVFAMTASQADWSPSLFLLAIPFGVFSIVLSRLRPAEEDSPDSLYGATVPFATFRDLAEAYHKTGFQKSRFPRHMKKRRVRSPFGEWLNELCQISTWSMCGPLILLFQVLPKKRSWTRARCAAS